MAKTRITSIRLPNDVHEDMKKVADLHFGGSINKAIVSSCRKMIKIVEKSQEQLLSGGK